MIYLFQSNWNIILISFLFLLPIKAYCDSESTIGGKTGAAHIIQNNGTSLRPRPYLNFTTGMTCTDTGGKTVCSSSGGSGGSGNVGIGTLNLLPVYVGVSTLGPSNIVSVNGNVGIGITPQTKLDIPQQSTFAYPTPGLTLGSINLLGTSAVNDDSMAITFDANGTGGTAHTAGAGIYAQMSGSYGSRMYLGTTNSFGTGSKARVMIDSSGNVGIGTNTAIQVPPAYLTVSGTSTLFSDPANSRVAAFMVTDGTGANTDAMLAMGANNSNQYGYIQAIQPGTRFNSLLLNASGGNVGVGTNLPSTLLEVGVRKLNVLSNGNIGIGINLPLSYIEAVAPSSVYTDPANTGTSSLAFMTGTGALTDNGLFFGNNDTDRYSYIQAVKAGTGFNKLLLNAGSGNVGIGTFNPLRNLDVSSVLTTGTVIKIANASTGGGAVGIVSTGSGSSGGAANLQLQVPDGTARMTLDTNGNVGINSTVPGARLDVVGNIRSLNFGASLPVCTDASKNLSTSGCASGSSQWTTINTNDVYLPNSGNVGIGTSLTTTSALTVMNGNVGIGTWKPIFPLDVNGKIHTNTFLEVGPNSDLEVGASSITTLNDLQISTGGALDISAAPLSSGISFQTDNTSIIGGSGGTTARPKSINVASNVGINTTGFQGSLTVVGSSVFLGNVGIGTTKTTTAALTVMNGNVGIGTFIPNSEFDVVGNGTGVSINPSNGATFFGTLAFNREASNGTIFKSTSSAYQFSNFNDRLQLEVYNGAGTQITSAAIAISSTGNVGIGTGNPTFALTVRPTTDVDDLALMQNNDGTAGWSMGGFNSGNLDVSRISSGVLSKKVSINQFGNVGIGTITPSTLLEVGSRRFNVLSGGNVGIGINVPAAKMQLVDSVPQTTFKDHNTGSFDIVGGDGSNSEFTPITLSDNGAIQLAKIAAFKTGGGSFLYMGTSNNYGSGITNTGIVINPSGNVGIGTDLTTGSGRLVVLGGNVGVGLASPTTGLNVVGERTYTYPNIGTSPGTMQVDGSAGTNDDSLALTFGQLAGGAAAPSSADAGIYVQSSGAYGSKMYLGTSASFATGPVSRLMINFDGNVGIGTVTPFAKLDVQGNIKVSTIGSTIGVVSGTNSCHGSTTLSGGTVTVSTTCTPSSASNIFLTDSGGGILANIGALSVGTVTGGTSFVINSSNALDSSNVGYIIIN